jgi:hypothetical protein
MLATRDARLRELLRTYRAEQAEKVRQDTVP